MADGDSLIRIATASKMDSNNPVSPDALTVDLDYSTQRSDLTITKCVKEVEKLRRHNRDLFEQLITNDYRTYLRGDAL
jgi:hypothetical protein